MPTFVGMKTVMLLAMMVAMPCLAQNKVRRDGSVLAHSLRYDPMLITDDMPPTLQQLLWAYQTQPRYADRMRGKAVEPLLSTVRDQYEPFNNSCPYYQYADGTLSPEPCISGCVATCIEQVLTYWRYPEALIDTLYGWETEHYVIDDVLPGTQIDWANVLDDYSNGYTEAQAKAVADLTYWCGVAAHMSWTPSSSGASLYRAFEPLWRAFNYQTIAFVQRCLYSNEAWNSMLRNELENGRPICYTGHNMALSGHAFNIDGVDEDGYYHLNWGYGGDYDGYYDLDFLNPFEQRTDATELGQQEGFFCNQTAMFMHPEDFVIDIYDTVSVQNALYGVSIDTVTFRRQPDTQGYTICDMELTNTTEDTLYFTVEALTYEVGDTAIFPNADYVALTSVSIAPGERKTWPVYCQFLESGDRIFALTSDEETMLYEMPLSVEVGVSPQLVFGSVSHELIQYGDDLTATFSLDVTNNASGGYAGNLVTYCLFPDDGSVDQRHWDVLSLAGGSTERLTTTFRQLTDGMTYTLRVRCPWTIQQEYTFTALSSEATDRVEAVAQEEGDGADPWYDLQGRPVTRPVRGLYVKHGKKILIR